MSVQTQPQLTQVELEQSLKDLGDEYNNNVELLSEAELKLNELKDNSFQLLRRLYNQRKFADPATHAGLGELEQKYETSETDISFQETDHYNKMRVCFRNLQKLRQLQNTYLVGIINGLQKELADLKGTQPPTSHPQRDDNLLS